MLCTLILRHAKMASTKTLAFKVTRKLPELISAAESTPYEFKFLSDIDEQFGLRFHVPLIHFFRKNPSMEGKDPVNIIRDAVSKALVFYYPLAGRLREYAGQKLAVECTGEGVVFVEADADVMLEQFGDDLYPPFPNLEEMLPDNVPGSQGDNCPLLIQVTRLRCGGFILAYRISHPICDGAGVHQFLSAVAELARGATAPSIPPTWERHLLSGPQPQEHEINATNNIIESLIIPFDETKVQRSFFFSNGDISALRRRLPPHLQSCSKFEVLAACTWRCQTIALSPEPDEDVGFVCAVDIRNEMKPALPAGYYGNCIVYSTAITTAEELCKKPLEHAVEVVRKAKGEAMEEYKRLVRSRDDDDAMVERDWPSGMAYATSNLVHAGFERVDFGWGEAAYGGVAEGVVDLMAVAQLSWYIPFKNTRGESGIVVPVCLPTHAMEDFVKQLQITITVAPFTLSPL